ncbi:SEC14-like protein 2 isoform X1 [Bradysia coprophila]|uniref:SEC14-like protein 2 isoform X1 n=1 Tax=Bradysia coprophila TaxID=38358 RepID=UPI00187DAEA6|nr:SEC14-like protein 2 isoform X1 [Bradysia coprophila]
MDTITDEEKAIVEKLRQNVKDELPLSVTTLSAEDQDLFLVRWVRARDLDLDKATNMLRNSLKWRIEKRADDALNFQIHPFLAENFVVRFSGTDKLGQPVFVVPLNEWDLRKVVNDADRLAGFDDFATNFFEVLSYHIKDEHNKRKKAGQGAITQMTLLLDVKNYSYWQLVNFGAIKKILQIAAMYEAHYPEILYRAAFINCPHYFGMFITLLKPVLAPKTLSKIVCYPKMSDWQNDIKELMDPDQIPERYGGTKISE